MDSNEGDRLRTPIARDKAVVLFVGSRARAYMATAITGIVFDELASRSDGCEAPMKCAVHLGHEKPQGRTARREGSRHPETRWRPWFEWRPRGPASVPLAGTYSNPEVQACLERLHALLPWGPSEH